MKYFLALLLLFSTPNFASEESLKDKLTIITTTSPIRSNPKTNMLEITQGSLFEIAGFAECKKIIVFDGVHPKQAFLKEAYEEYKNRVIELTKTHPHFQNTELVFCSEHRHLAMSLKNAMDRVTTPFVFVHQHDFKIRRPQDIDAFEIIRSMEDNPNLKHIRLHRRWNTVCGFDYHIDDIIDGPAYVPLTRTFGWSDNDHFTRKDYYDDFVFPLIKHPWPMEWALHPLEKEMTQENPDNHRLFGTYLYGKLGDGRYIVHLNGKKWE